MRLSRCGLDCSKCEWKENCSGCAATDGKPFGGDCMLARCSRQKGLSSCRECAAGGCFGESAKACMLKQQLIAEYHALGIADMEQVSDLNALKGSYVNLEYTLPSGQKVKLWDDNRIYLGSQVCKKDSDRCYGLTADENYLCVCEYGENGSDAQLVVYQRRKG